MHYPRPLVQSHRRIPQVAAVRPQSSLVGLGEMGDLIDGNAAMNNFQNALKNHIIAKAGTQNTANGNAVKDLPSLVSFAAVTFDLGSQGNLQPALQSTWNAWQNAASGVNADQQNAWLFGRFVAMNKSELMRAVAATNPADSANQVSVTLMVPGVALSNSQWATLFTKAWSVVMRAVNNGVLTVSYLDVLVRAFVQPAASRRFPVFSCPPGGVPATDPKAIAFRAMLKQIGWSGVVQEWFGMTQQAWAAESAQAEAADAYYTSAITSLSYVSGAKILEQIEQKLTEYWQQRDQALSAFAAYDQMWKGPLSGEIPYEMAQKMDQLKQEFNTADQQAFTALNAVGMWPSGTKSGGLQGLGFVSAIVYGAVGVTLLGVLAYIVALMTGTARTATGQSRAVADSILAAAKSLSDSCAREYAQSRKTPADEEKYRACVARSAKMASDVPQPPEVTSDIMGFKGLAMAATALVGGLVVIKLISGPKTPKSFKVVPE